jgi:biotin carboxyl carrier protein
MELQIEVNGRVRAVRVEPHEGRFRVTIDGRERLVDAASVDEMTYSLICLSEAQQSIQAGLAETGLPGELAVHMANGVAAVRVLAGGASRFGRGAAPAAAVAGAKAVLAPMPGKIVKVLVAAGDPVAARQGLIVVEAMKMENELRSPKEGRVTEVLVAEGMSVEAGRPLVIVE